jgi:hypothetical protein
MTLHIYMVLVGQAYTECVAKFNFHHWMIYGYSFEVSSEQITVWYFYLKNVYKVSAKYCCSEVRYVYVTMIHNWMTYT